MQFTASTVAAFMLLAGAQAQDPGLKLQAFRNPDCATDSNMKPTTRDCQNAIDSIRGLQDSGGMGSDVLTCREVASSGGCAISLCDANSPSTTVAYAAIAIAAQLIHAHCKGDPSTAHTGGNARVVGFEQKGEFHSDATVYLGPKGIDPLHPPKFRRGSKWIAASSPDVEERSVNVTNLVAREDDRPTVVDVDGTPLQLRLESGNSQNYNTYFPNEIAQTNQDLVTNALLRTWGGQQPRGGHPTQLRERVTDDSVEWTVAVYAHNGADIGESYISPAYRRRILQTVWSMWNRNLGPGTFTVAVHDILFGRTVAHVTINGVNRGSIGSLLGAVVYAEEFI